ncbi:hypothetical protein L6164_003625 [Bauhinia variegata]|uniref:Uncharacterized protein n=1 Tax=Bauhinia variegata TaxID=167791 RepID=A0ACB9Q1W0_BAUVA|nr:hypothetical protein L6164_003625 [Bauhinia variegata]
MDRHRNRSKTGYRDAVFDGRKIYAVSALEFFEIDIESGEVIKVQLPRAVMENFDSRRIYLYVVGTPDGEIMVIIRYANFVYSEYKYGKTCQFAIYKKLNDEEGEWSSVNNLRDYVLMLGYNNTSVCMLPCTFSDGKGNCIYYTDDIVQGHFCHITNYDVGYFDLENRTTHQLFPTSLYTCISSDPIPPAPVWFIYKATYFFLSFTSLYFCYGQNKICMFPLLQLSSPFGVNEFTIGKLIVQCRLNMIHFKVEV